MTTSTLLLSFVLVQAPAPPAMVDDPDHEGPFAVGFTSYITVDPTRDGDGSSFQHRPLPVYVWYPVDRQTIDATTPEARYPLDPLYGGAPVGGLRDALSSDLERYGINRAFQEPATSSLRPFPLLVFSPGWRIPAWRHASIGARLASHGFVVAVTSHFGEGDAWFAWVPTTDPMSVSMFHRPRDVSFVLTDLLEKSRTPGHLLVDAIRSDQVAVGGWSLGGYTAMTLAGGDDSVCDGPSGLVDDPPPPGTCAPSSPDPRFKAIVPLDGSNQFLYFHELSRVTLPAMGLGEEWSGLFAQNPSDASWQARQHAAFSGNPSYRVDVFNTNHQSFADVCEDAQVLGDLGVWSPSRVARQLALRCVGVTPSGEAHRIVNKYLIAFLKTHLTQKPGYEAILTPGHAITTEPLVEFFVTEKRSPNSISAEWPADFVYFPHQPGTEQFRAQKDPSVRRPVEAELALE